MKKLFNTQNSIDKKHYIYTIHYSIDSAFKMLANNMGDKLMNFEQMHISESALINSNLYDSQLMDQFAEELDFILHINKNRIKAEVKNSVSEHITNLKSLSLDNDH